MDRMIVRLFASRCSTLAAQVLHRLDRALPLLFLAYALPAILFMSVTMPIYMNPDEPAHAMRAEQIGYGELFTRRTGPLEAGGTADTGLVQLMSVQWPLLGEPEHRVTQDMSKRARAVAWSGSRMTVNIPNTAVYPPTLYLPVIAGIGIGKALHLPVETSLILARLLNGGTAAALVALAIALAARGRFAIFTVMLLPMALAQFASCSQDAMLLAGGALLAALLSRPLLGKRAATTAEYLGAGLLVALLSMSRPTNLAFILPLLLPSIVPRWTGRVSALSVVGAAVAATLAWVALAALLIQVPQPHSGFVPSIMGQIHHLIGDPLSLLSVLWNTAVSYWYGYYVMLVGLLCWGSCWIFFPSWFYLAAAGVFLLATLFECLSLPGLRGNRLAVLWVSVLASVLGILLLQYLSFSPVGGPVVEGVQGRYFLPIAIMVPLLLPTLPVRSPAMARLPLLLPVLGFPIVTLLLLPPLVIGRLYLQAG